MDENLTGKQLPEASKWNANLGGEYTYPFQNGAEASFRIDAQCQPPTFANGVNGRWLLGREPNPTLLTAVTRALTRDVRNFLSDRDWRGIGEAHHAGDEGHMLAVRAAALFDEIHHPLGVVRTTWELCRSRLRSGQACHAVAWKTTFLSPTFRQHAETLKLPLWHSGC